MTKLFFNRYIVPLLLFIIFPFGAFFFSLRNLKLRSNGFIFVLFSALYGYSMNFQLDTADSYRLALWFIQSDKSFEEIITLYQLGIVVDIYKNIVYTFVGGFTNNPKVLFAVFGAVFGLFCYLSIRLLLNERIGKSNKFFIILLFVFFATNSLVNINGIRFWTATWVFFYSVVKYIVYGNKKWIIGLLIIPLIHFSFLFLILFLFLFKLTFFIFRDKIKYYFYIFLFSFVFSLFSPQMSDSDFLSDDTELVSSSSINDKIHIYSGAGKTSEEKIDKSLYRKANNIFTETFRYVLKISAFIIGFIIYKKYKYINKSKFTDILFLLVLFLFSWAFLASSFFSSGQRFIIVFWLLFLYLLFKIYNQNRDCVWCRRIIMFLIPIFSYQISFMFYNGFRLVDSTLWFANLPYIIYDGISFRFPYFLN
jgi:hypothetical protein